MAETTKKQQDPELKAMKTVVDVLEKQPPSARKRILEYALARIDASPYEQPQPAPQA